MRKGLIQLSKFHYLSASYYKMENEKKNLKLQAFLEWVAYPNESYFQKTHNNLRLFFINEYNSEWEILQ